MRYNKRPVLPSDKPANRKFLLLRYSARRPFRHCPEENVAMMKETTEVITSSAIMPMVTLGKLGQPAKTSAGLA